jgi:hypothetical protein
MHLVSNVVPLLARNRSGHGSKNVQKHGSRHKHLGHHGQTVHFTTSACQESYVYLLCCSSHSLEDGSEFGSTVATARTKDALRLIQHMPPIWAVVPFYDAYYPATSLPFLVWDAIAAKLV